MKKTELSQIGLSLMTGIFLVGLHTANSLVDQLIEVGQMSEEIFRGDRLPILNLTPRDEEIS